MNHAQLIIEKIWSNLLKRGFLGFLRYLATFLLNKLYLLYVVNKIRLQNSFFKRANFKHDSKFKSKTLFIDDVYLISYPKAGRTWVRVMLAKLLNLMGGDSNKLELIRLSHDNAELKSDSKM